VYIYHNGFRKDFAEGGECSLDDMSTSAALCYHFYFVLFIILIRCSRSLIKGVLTARGMIILTVNKMNNRAYHIWKDFPRGRNC
jgi:hypothetical protein